MDTIRRRTSDLYQRIYWNSTRGGFLAGFGAGIVGVRHRLTADWGGPLREQALDCHRKGMSLRGLFVIFLWLLYSFMGLWKLKTDVKRRKER